MEKKEKQLSQQFAIVAERESLIQKLREENSGLRQTLDVFKISGVLSSATEKERFKNKFSLMLSEAKIRSKIVDFLIPRDMLELSLTCKIVNSQVRHTAAIFSLIARNSMWDKENIQYTTLKGKVQL